MKYLVLSLVFFMLLGACSHKAEDTNLHKEEIEKKTVWTERAEFHIEHSEPIAGQKTEFLIHITDLHNFRPPESGILTLTFVPASGEPLAVKLDAPARPGVFVTHVSFKDKGKYILKIAFAGKQLSDQISLSHIAVRGSQDKEGEERGSHKNKSAIAFSKEQQWKVDFKVESPVRKTVSSFFVSPGELVTVSDNEVTLSAPLAGILSVSRKLPYLGKKVNTGEVVAAIDPPVHQQGGLGQLASAYADAKNRHILAIKESERAQRLYEAKAVPRRRVDEAALALDSAKAGLDPIEKAMESMQGKLSEQGIKVKSPLSGTVIEVFAANGKAVEVGQPLVKIVNTSSLWLRANIPATEMVRLHKLEESTFTVTGVDNPLRPVRLVAVNDIVDAKSRTVAAIFEVDNKKGLLKAGMFADVSIRTGHEQDALTLPESALFEDEGKFFVYVQVDGESFERREIKTGIRGRGIVQIGGGVKEDERVVTKGAYYVKLASLSSRAPQGDGHAH